MAPVTGISSTPKTSAKTVGVAARGTGVGVRGVGVGVGDTGDGLGDALGERLGDGDGLGDRVGDGEGLGLGVSVGAGLRMGLGGGNTIAVAVGTGVGLAAILPKPRPGNIRSKTWPHVTTTTAATSTTSRVSTCGLFIRNLLSNRRSSGRFHYWLPGGLVTTVQPPVHRRRDRIPLWDKKGANRPLV